MKTKISIPTIYTTKQKIHQNINRLRLENINLLILQHKLTINWLAYLNPRNILTIFNLFVFNNRETDRAKDYSNIPYNDLFILQKQFLEHNNQLHSKLSFVLKFLEHQSSLIPNVDISLLENISKHLDQINNDEELKIYIENWNFNNQERETIKEIFEQDKEEIFEQNERETIEN